ncbi:DUF4124 domain-containing protein [Cupriavidus oxalaticus]|uniref:hypothetical protein n=1 Tax=Cupriavidus oxalaticus TaxID=96344 RepID=UPI003F738B42
MRAFDFIAIFGLVTAAFFAGISYNADRIKATCESDDAPLVINGTEFVCLSQRHIDMLRQRQLQPNRRQS